MSYSKSNLEATKRYQSKLSSISIRVKEDDYDRYKACAEQLGLPFRQFIISALEEKLKTVKEEQ